MVTKTLRDQGVVVMGQATMTWAYLLMIRMFLTFSSFIILLRKTPQQRMLKLLEKNQVRRKFGFLPQKLPWYRYKVYYL